jgi:4-amino-4-deoxy-L-arabinose transferase-like glycosyltransferase
LTQPRGPIPRRRWEWLAVPAIAGAASALLTWDRWIRPFVDGSRELQVPARIAEGERLYRDVAYYYGPAAPWANAAAFELFGRRFAVLEAIGALAASVLLVAVYHLARRAGSPLSAGVAVTVSAAICVGAPNGGAFLFPYAFAALFAVAAGLVCLATLTGSPSRLRSAIGSMALAVSLLSKPEIGAAAAAVLLVAGLRSEEGRVERRRTLVTALVGVLIAVAGYAFAFRGIPLASLASEGPLVLVSPPPEWRQVYRLISGLDDPGAAVSRLATALFLDGLVLGAAWLVARTAGSREKPGAGELLWWAALAAAVLFAATGAGGEIEDRLPPLLTPAPLAAGLAALGMLRTRWDERGRARWLLFAFAALVGSRVALNVAYGFVTTPYAILALPGLAASASVLLLDVLAPRLSHPPAFRRAVAAALLALAAAGLVRLDRIRRSVPVAELETAAGALRLPEPWGSSSKLVLDFLAGRARPGDTLACLPECGVFNFVGGLRNPLRQEQILPGHLDPKTEAEVADRIRNAGPRFFVLVHQAPPGWAAARFGNDYAREIARAIAESYVPAGAARSPDGVPLVQVLERRPYRIRP